jgi:hypothetical protein
MVFFPNYCLARWSLDMYCIWTIYKKKFRLASSGPTAILGGRASPPLSAEGEGTPYELASRRWGSYNLLYIHGYCVSLECSCLHEQVATVFTFVKYLLHSSREAVSRTLILRLVVVVIGRTLAVASSGERSYRMAWQPWQLPRLVEGYTTAKYIWRGIQRTSFRYGCSSSSSLAGFLTTDFLLLYSCCPPTWGIRVAASQGLLRPRGEERWSESVLAGGNGHGGIKLWPGRRPYLPLPMWGLSIERGSGGGRRQFFVFGIGPKLCYLYTVLRNSFFNLAFFVLRFGVLHAL